MLDRFYDVDQDISSDSDSDYSEYKSDEEEFLGDFHDPHQYGLWNPVKKSFAFWPENSINERYDRMPYHSKFPEKIILKKQI